MKTLQIDEMQDFVGGDLTKCDVGVIVGCGLAGAAIGAVSGGAGFLFGVYCSAMAEANDVCA